MARTVAHVYRRPAGLPIAPQYIGKRWVSLNETSSVWRWTYEERALARATARHILRYRRDAGTRDVKERPVYVRRQVAVHDYDRTAYRRAGRVAVMVAKYRASDRNCDRMAGRSAVRWANTPDGGDVDLTELYGQHWKRHTALRDW